MKTSQPGWLMTGIFTPSVLLLAYLLLFKIGITELTPFLILGSTIIVLIACLLIFYKLTIEIDDQQLKFWFGFGLISKKYKLEDIEECKAVTNSPLYGWGIRMLPNGWLYNVSGCKAIELTFKHTSKRVRIGTNQPDEIAEYVNKLLIHQDRQTFSIEEKRSFHKQIFWGVLIIIPLLVVILFYYGIKEPVINVNADQLKIKGMYGLSIDLKQITQIDTLSRLPRVLLRTNGFSLGKYNKGHFKVENIGTVLLFIKCGNPPYIHIRYNQGKDLYLNLNNRTATKSLFQKIYAITATRINQ